MEPVWLPLSTLHWCTNTNYPSDGTDISPAVPTAIRDCRLLGHTPSPGGVAYCADNAAYVAAQLGGDHWAVKAQIHAGGRCAAESGDISSAREGDEASP